MHPRAVERSAAFPFFWELQMRPQALFTGVMVLYDSSSAVPAMDSNATFIPLLILFKTFPHLQPRISNLNTDGKWKPLGTE